MFVNPSDGSNLQGGGTSVSGEMSEFSFCITFPHLDPMNHHSNLFDKFLRHSTCNGPPWHFSPALWTYHIRSVHVKQFWTYHSFFLVLVFCKILLYAFGIGAFWISFSGLFRTIPIDSSQKSHDVTEMCLYTSHKRSCLTAPASPALNPTEGKGKAEHTAPCQRLCFSKQHKQRQR